MTPETILAIFAGIGIAGTVLGAIGAALPEESPAGRFCRTASADLRGLLALLRGQR